MQYHVVITFPVIPDLNFSILIFMALVQIQHLSLLHYDAHIACWQFDISPKYNYGAIGILKIRQDLNYVEGAGRGRLQRKS